MRKIYTLLFVVAVVFSLNLSAQVYTKINNANSADWYLVDVTSETKQVEFEIGEASDAPTLDDNEIDADIWDATPWYPYQVLGIRTDNVLSDKGPDNQIDSSDFSAAWKAVWDDTRIYWLLRIQDDSVYYRNDFNQFWGQDALEFYYIPQSDPTLAVRDNDANRVQRDDSTKSIFHVIMNDFEGNPVKLALANTAGSTAETPTDGGWRFAGGQNSVYYLESFAWRDAGYTYFKVGVMGLGTIPTPLDGKTAYAADDILLWECTINEQDADPAGPPHGGNREAYLQVVADSGEAGANTCGGPRNYAKLKLVEGAIVSASNVSADQMLKLYPNPATDMVRMNATTDVYIYNISGQLVKSELNTKTFSVSSLSQGVYFVKDAAGSVTKLVVK